MGGTRLARSRSLKLMRAISPDFRSHAPQQRDWTSNRCGNKFRWMGFGPSCARRALLSASLRPKCPRGLAPDWYRTSSRRPFRNRGQHGKARSRATFRAARTTDVLRELREYRCRRRNSCQRTGGRTSQKAMACAKGSWSWDPVSTLIGLRKVLRKKSTKNNLAVKRESRWLRVDCMQ
jgi:hypothetical protein